MTGSKGPLPPQGNHPDQWPELSEPDQRPAQAGQPPQQAWPQQGHAPATEEQVAAPQSYHLPQHQQQTLHGTPAQQQGAPVQQQQPQAAPGQPQQAASQQPAAPQPQYTAPLQDPAAVPYAGVQPDQHAPAAAPPQQADFSSQFDRYAPPPVFAPPAPEMAPPTQHQQPPGYAAPAPAAAPDPHLDQRGTIQEHWQQPAAAQPLQGEPQQEPQGYDLGQYMPAATAAPGPAYGAEAHQQPGQHGAGHAQMVQPDWSGQDAMAAPAAGYDAGQAAIGGLDEGYDDGDGESDYDEPRGSRRGLLITAALVGAIGLGGGLAYAYKFLGSGSDYGNPPKVIKANKGPLKIRPANPGGRQFANKDSSVLNRLRDRGNGNARVVRSLVISPNGSVVPPRAKPAPLVQVQPANNRLQVPGVFISGLPPLRQAPKVVTPKQVRPAIIAAAPRLSPPRPALRPTKPAAVRLPKARPLVKTKPVVRSQVRKAAVRPPAVSTGSSPGYVAWISSSKDRLRSLAEFANLQQKHSGVLAGKQPEIEAIDLGAVRGVWYRLRIGPPVSKQAAVSLCKALLDGKGVKECLVRRY